MNSVAEWEEIHKSRMWGTYPDIHVVRQVKKFMAWHIGSGAPQALDIGCGVGACSFMMVSEGMNVFSFDGSESAVSRMVDTIYKNRLEPRICVKPADAQTVEFPAESFDFILDNFTLTYLEHPPWERILSWLRPGGKLIHVSFETAPKGTPMAWEHKEPGHVVERHSSWVEGNAFSFVVRKYVKPCA